MSSNSLFLVIRATCDYSVPYDSDIDSSGVTSVLIVIQSSCPSAPSISSSPAILFASIFAYITALIRESFLMVAYCTKLCPIVVTFPKFIYFYSMSTLGIRYLTLKGILNFLEALTVQIMSPLISLYVLLKHVMGTSFLSSAANRYAGWSTLSRLLRLSGSKSILNTVGSLVVFLIVR